MTTRDHERLTGVHPELQHIVNLVLSGMEAYGHPMFVIEGLRTLERQKVLFAQGRTTPGHIVTYCDGIKNPSHHQVRADGFGHAVDCAFVDDPQTPETVETWSEKSPWRVYGEMAKWLGCDWGGDWPSRKTDRPHIELPFKDVRNV